MLGSVRQSTRFLVSWESQGVWSPMYKLGDRLGLKCGLGASWRCPKPGCDSGFLSVGALPFVRHFIKVSV